MMKKISLLFILIFTWGSSQIEKNFGDNSEPMPSVSSFSSYVNTPVSLSTGVPGISVPLFTLPAGGKALELPIVLSYHVYNTGKNKPASEVGLGWSLLKGGTISRVIKGEVDEAFSDPAKSNYTKNAFDDIYYYDIPGNSGKFKFVRDIASNTFTLNNISGNPVKIGYTRDSNNATLVLTSFTITDDKGISYIFEDYSISRFDTGSQGFNYKSAFFLSRIIDENGVEAARFSYQKNTKYSSYSATTLLYQNCKLDAVTTQYGKVTFENSYTSSLEAAGKDDPYQIKSVLLWDNASHLISKYTFQYSDFHSTAFPGNSNEGKRILIALNKLDKNQQITETRTFEYDTTGSETAYSPSPNAGEYSNFLCPDPLVINPGTYTIGLLKKMTLPEKGYVIYNFEANEVYANRSNVQLDNNTLTDPALQYLNLTSTISYDTNTSRNYTFQVTETRKFYIKQSIDETYVISNYPHEDIIIDPEYKLLTSGGTEVFNYTSCSPGIREYALSPGIYTFKISRGNGKGTLKSYIIVTMPKPYKNKSVVKEAARIGSIKYYDALGSLQKTIAYTYDSFAGPNDSSGNIFAGEVCDEWDYDNSFILYKNVKEIYGGTSGSIGYSRYYFKTPDDYASISNPSYKPHFNIASSGILFKKEVFGQQNQLVSDENTDYVLEEISNAPEYSLCLSATSKASRVKSLKMTSNTYYSNGSSLQNIAETFFNPVNFQPYLVKETSPEGRITEKTISYATDLGNTRLVNAGMLSIPLRTEVKIDGALVSKTETRYEAASHLYPTSVAVYDMQNQNPDTAATLDQYDNKGNLLQMTGKDNVPAVTVWGYYQTQPIAKIVGLSYNQVIALQTTVAAIAASNADADNPANEQALLQALENLRKDPALSNSSVTTYTYDPMVGVTNTISPTGMKTTYRYDAAGRLEKVEDAGGKLLKEFKYNYKN
ncbi:YD repeat-containing protein [Chryseobacterium vietnamense]|uniref:RHS repeat domain-containing protein n=1 Tax=Chryseobacterium vietnamense TaxID=866785 RepID=UPI00285E6C35|nr:RHS repeat domain-containing protein [Chryseobacterium vietnamense]MDR6485902.1 YD repeat-containing protein [Chryseobacterium vietnamense]